MVVMDRLPDDYVHFFDLPLAINHTWNLLFDGVAEALREMHEANIVHDNLCNTTVMVKKTDSKILFMLVDFSLSTRAEYAGGR